MNHPIVIKDKNGDTVWCITGDHIYWYNEISKVSCKELMSQYKSAKKKTQFPI